MSLVFLDRNSERTAIALNLIENIDQALEKIHQDIALATAEYDGACRNAEYAKRIHHVYSSCSSGFPPPMNSPSKIYRLDSEPLMYSSSPSIHPISPLMKSPQIENQADYLLKLEREQHAHTKDKLENSLQSEEKLQQIIQLLQSKLSDLQVRILAAEKDAEIALDLAKSNEVYIQQLESELKLHLESSDDPFRKSTCLSRPPKQTISEITANRAMITCGREILQKRRLARHT